MKLDWVVYCDTQHTRLLAGSNRSPTRLSSNIKTDTERTVCVLDDFLNRTRNARLLRSELRTNGDVLHCFTCFLVVSQLFVCFVITIIQVRETLVKSISKLFCYFFGDFRLRFPCLYLYYTGEHRHITLRILGNLVTVRNLFVITKGGAPDLRRGIEKEPF